MPKTKTILSICASIMASLASAGSAAHGIHSYDAESSNPPTAHSIKSKYPDEERKFQVQLPVGYHDEVDERYPVMYILDADKPFRLAQTVSTINILADMHKIPKLIVVALPNSSDHARNRDYTPSRKADQFLDFLEMELIPYVDRNFRTEPCRIINGLSRSGLFVMHSLLTRPSLFRAHLAFSGAFWHDDDLVIDEARKSFKSRKSLNGFLYINIGGEENENITNSFDRMQFILRRFAPEGLDWQADYAEYESHGTTRAIGQHIALRKFFTNWDKPWAFAQTWQSFENSGGLPTILKNYEALSQEYGYTVRPDAGGLNDVGGYYLHEARAKEAIEVFLLCTRNYPHSIDAHEGLAKAYVADGQSKFALSAVDRAIELAQSKDDEDRLESVSEFRREIQKASE